MKSSFPDRREEQNRILAELKNNIEQHENYSKLPDDVTRFVENSCDLSIKEDWNNIENKIPDYIKELIAE